MQTNLTFWMAVMIFFLIGLAIVISALMGIGIHDERMMTIGTIAAAVISILAGTGLK